MIHISALSPNRFPVLRILVYPPGREIIFGDTSLKSSETANLFCKYRNTILLECKESSFALVIKGSTYLRKAFALGTVVVILLCMINDVAILDNIAFLCELFRLRCSVFFLCLISLFFV